MISYCHDCACKEGELHNYFPECDMEKCPLCKGQLLSCGCDKSKITEDMREPYFVKISCCKRCGKKQPNMMMVSDGEWEKICAGTYDEEDILCKKCMEFIMESKNIKIKQWRFLR